MNGAIGEFNDLRLFPASFALPSLALNLFSARNALDQPFVFSLEVVTSSSRSLPLNARLISSIILALVMPGFLRRQILITCSALRS